MDDYQRAFGGFMIFGTPLVLMLIGTVSFLICLTVLLKRLILKQNDSDWLGKKGVLVSIVLFLIGLGIGSVVFSQLH